MRAQIYIKFGACLTDSSGQALELNKKEPDPGSFFICPHYLLKVPRHLNLFYCLPFISFPKPATISVMPKMMVIYL